MCSRPRRSAIQACCYSMRDRGPPTMTTPYSRYSGTQTNLTYSFGSFSSSGSIGAAEAAGTAPAAIRKLVIVGGGTARWKAGMSLANALLPKGVEITVLESPAVPIIGGGEGST